MNSNILSNLTIDLDRTAHEYAAKFAAGQTSIAKGRKLYLNTLAVCAVRQYLSCACQLDLDLSQGDSWQVEGQSIMDVADLVIPDVGKIECLVVLPNTTQVMLPLASIDERIGDIFVQFNEDLNSVELLGFMPRTISTTISVDLSQLQPLDDLLDLIYSTQIHNLREMLAGIFDRGWEPIANLIDGTKQPEFALRNALFNISANSSYDSIRGFTAGKTIELRSKLASFPLLILIGLSNESDGRVKVKIRLHSGGGVPVLPANIKLTLQAENGNLLSEVQYPRSMNFIQLQSFKLQPGTEFKIQICLGDDRFTESFIA